MEKIVKFPKRQDCHYKLTPGNSGETSINISKEVFKFIQPEEVPLDTEVDISFTIFKDDYIKALCYIINQLPLYKTESNKSVEIPYSADLFVSYYDSINKFFGTSDTAIYHTKLLNRREGRIYLKDLKDKGFNIRHFLVESNSVLVFSKTEYGINLRVETGSEIFSKYSKKDTEDTQDIIVAEKELKAYIYETVKFLYKLDVLNSLVPFIATEIQPEVPIKIASTITTEGEQQFNLTGMFIETTESGLADKNTNKETGKPKPRWFNEKFTLAGHTVYLSSEWYGKEKNTESMRAYSLTLKDFNTMLEVCYPGMFSYSKEDDKHTLRKKKGIAGKPIQTIYYGAPGTGKSYKVKHEIIPSGVDYYTVTFYSDYYYSDFVGGIRPVCTDKGLEYKFQPGPFARALKDSFTKPVFLVIEEINRGNAAAIFGDIFQLLDRKSGTSDYSITNHDLYKYLTEEGKISLPEDKIYLPSNLNIVCTMNTADQNVFVLDSAFKRRFKMEYVPIDFNAYYKDDVLQEGCKGYIEKCDIFNIGSFETDWKKVIPAHMHEEITTKVKEAGRNWPTFAAYVNAKIDEINSSEQKISEDKKLGPFFIDVEELDNIKAFVDKVIYYLKQDVFKYEDNILDESYETLYSKIISGKYDLFGILDLKK